MFAIFPLFFPQFNKVFNNFNNFFNNKKSFQQSFQQFFQKILFHFSFQISFLFKFKFKISFRDKISIEKNSAALCCFANNNFSIAAFNFPNLTFISNLRYTFLYSAPPPQITTLSIIPQFYKNFKFSQLLYSSILPKFDSYSALLFCAKPANGCAETTFARRFQQK